MSKSQYYGRLEGAVKARYDLKIQCIRGLDPYFLKTGFTSNLEGIPLTYAHIQYYLVEKTSFYSCKQFAARKSMLAENFVASDKVNGLEVRRIGDYFVVKGSVAPSMKNTESLRQPWAIIYKAGIVESAHCTCMAGLGECCSHVAALLFCILHLREQASITSVTDRPAYWKVPATRQPVPMSAIQDIDFGTPRAIIMKKRSAPETTPSRPLKHPEMTDVELDDVLMKIREVGQVDCATHLVRQPFAQRFEATCVGLPPSLRSLYKPEHQLKSLEELRQLGRATDVALTPEQIKMVFNKTKDQAKKRVWFTMKEGRPGASLLHAACHTSLETPAYSVIKKIVNPYQCRFTSIATKYGCTHEKDAMKDYIKQMKSHHKNFKYQESGWIINPNFIEVGASPDGLVTCDCCGSGCVEIKCPFCWDNLTMNEVQRDLERGLASQCLAQTLDEETGEFKYILKKTHKFYYQVQQQIFVADVKFCDFIVWNENVLIRVRVEPDQEFWEDKYSTIKTFFYNIVMPELLAKFYSRRNEEEQRAAAAHKRGSEAPQGVKKKSKKKPKTQNHPQPETPLNSHPIKPPLQQIQNLPLPKTYFVKTPLNSHPIKPPLQQIQNLPLPKTCLVKTPLNSHPILVKPVSVPKAYVVKTAPLQQSPRLTIPAQVINTPVRGNPASNHVPAKPRSTFYHRLLMGPK